MRHLMKMWHLLTTTYELYKILLEFFDITLEFIKALCTLIKAKNYVSIRYANKIITVIYFLFAG